MQRLVSLAAVLLVACLVHLTVPDPVLSELKTVPPELEPWRAWVLHDQPQQDCPPHFDDPTLRRCWWPARLDIDVGNQGGLFELAVRVFAASWVTLPGNGTHWPESVSSGDGNVPVSDRSGKPSIWLEPGEHRIRGAFVWDPLPDLLQVPAAAGMLSLKIDGREVSEPDLDTEGRLRLRRQGSAGQREDTLTVALFRLVEDDIPMRVVTHVRLEVSGRPRDIRLAVRLPEVGVAMKIDSPLPTRLADNGDLLVQARPGRWQIDLTERLKGPLTTLAAGKGPYGEETWSFRAFNHLRMVRVTGAPSVEPSRTRMPETWKRFPAYLVRPGEALSFEVIRRGDPDPPPDQLSLERTWWLDFDGSGFTVHDRIQGSLRRTWHLAMEAPLELGRVAVNGRDQLITLQNDTPSRPGVQLRHGRLALEADSRLPQRTVTLPAVGWDHDFQSVHGTLHLPPGWSLFSIAGVDSASGAWLQGWTLLDLFLVLIIAISTYKLRDRKAAGLVLITLVLIFHEPGAPRLVWLHLLAVTALLKVLPDGGIRRLVKLWGAAAIVALVVMALPFTVQQVRNAIYPQLASGGIGPPPMPMADRAIEKEAAVLSETTTLAKRAGKAAGVSLSAAPPAPSQEVSLQTDPDALIQTGPGLPTWRWRSLALRWNGPVDRSQQMRLWLVSPLMNRLLGFIRVALLLLTIEAFLDARNWRRHLPAPLMAGISMLVLMAVVVLPAPPALAQPSASGFPPQPLLDELKRRLLEPAPCFPQCADISRLELAATPDQVRLILQAHAQVDTAIPLPATMDTWRPSQLTLDNEPVDSLARDDRGNLWMVLPRGVHRIKMTGPTGSADEIRITLPILPHVGTYAGVGWRAQGFRPDNSLEGTIALTRIKKEGGPAAAVPKADVPAFFEVARTLHLGIQWEVTTHIRRLTAPGVSAVLAVPLLPQASLTTPGIQVVDGAAQITMAPEQTEARFSTTLPVSPSITLTAPQDKPWTERWTLEAAAIWRCLPSGLPAIHHQDDASTWQPQWRPWPGEQLTLAVSRPAAVPGRTVTIDSARLELTPGQRFAAALLTLGIQASKGGHQQIELPEMANLQSVTLDGKTLPIRQDGRLVSIPLQPGRQTVAVQWLSLNNSMHLLRSPRIHVGDLAVNAAVTFHMPDHRWILLTGGPRWGPAVLFWSYLLVVLLAAIGLGKTTVTPLRTIHWILLGLGLTQLPAVVAVAVVGWLLALGYRCRREAVKSALAFNAVQMLLVLLTLIALAGLYTAVERGLLGIPDMQIAGNQSTRLQLNWTQDRIAATLPTPWVVSLPQWIYHLLMLAWSLWMAFHLVGWLRWGWGCFAKTTLWRPIAWRRKAKSKSEPAVKRSDARTESTPPAEGWRPVDLDGRSGE